MKRFLLFGLLLAAGAAAGGGAAAPETAIPNERLLNPDIAVYRRSPTELWVYDTRPEVGVGSHHGDATALEQMRALKMRLMRITMYWHEVENTATPGRYDPAALARWDDIARRCEQAGIVPVVVVHGNPPGVGYANRQEGYRRFARFMGDMAARYPTIRFWELWNEMDAAFTDLFGAGRDDVPLRERGRMYAQMLELAYPAIKKANPRAWVLTGGMTDWNEFPRGIYEGGGRDYFDFLNLHTYGVPVLYAFVGRGLALYRLMREFGDDGRPLWNTEFGIDAGNVVNAWGFPHARTPPEEDAASFDEVQRQTWQECLEDNLRRRLYVKALGYQLAAGNETAQERMEKEARLPAGHTPHDYGFGLLRADRRTPRPAFTYLQKRDFNAPLRKQESRTLDIELYVPDGATPIGHEFDYQWRRPWMIIKNVTVNTLEPTVIRLQPPALEEKKP